MLLYDGASVNGRKKILLFLENGKTVEKKI